MAVEVDREQLGGGGELCDVGVGARGAEGGPLGEAEDGLRLRRARGRPSPAGEELCAGVSVIWIPSLVLARDVASRSDSPADGERFGGFVNQFATGGESRLTWVSAVAC